MSEKIKAVYLDSNGNQHDTKAAAKKANRLIWAADRLGETISSMLSRDDIEDDIKRELRDISSIEVEYARAVVSIYGMKDKSQ